MAQCRHTWEMTNITFGFVVFERCFHCQQLRTFFSQEDHPYLGEGYKEEDHYWNRMEAAQTFQFDLTCGQCGQTVAFRDLMGLLHCTGCLADCPVNVRREQLEKERTFVLVAFGFLPHALEKLFPEEKLDLLSEYFNARRDTTRSKIKILPFTLIKDLPRCKGDFIHDVGMLSQEPVTERKPLL
jgi:hypothetical protein